MRNVRIVRFLRFLTFLNANFYMKKLPARKLEQAEIQIDRVIGC